jgi:hypothetical protein
LQKDENRDQRSGAPPREPQACLDRAHPPQHAAFQLTPAGMEGQVCAERAFRIFAPSPAPGLEAALAHHSIQGRMRW